MVILVISDSVVQLMTHCNLGEGQLFYYVIRLK